MTDEPKQATEVVAALAECEEQVDHLKRENRLLRDASRTFGALAERLNASLESERRSGGERRTQSRGSGDRRQITLAADASRR
jgi:hypothetical protein